MDNKEDRITSWFAGKSRLNLHDFPIGIGDDMAEIRLSDETTVLITTDMLLDGVHFDLQTAGLKQAGYKAMATSLSDCAAMATIPVAAVAAVALPKGFGEKELKELHSGIMLAAEKYNCPLIGGDITTWKGKEPFAVNITMLSRRAVNVPVKRSGAKVGDCICVTGTLGGSLHGKHLTFEPRVKEAIKITNLVKLNSMMDISDGLSTDLNRICGQSKVGAILHADKIPISEDAKKSSKPLESALNDGEDFELLFTLSEKNCDNLLKIWNGPLKITCIGKITDSGRLEIQENGVIRELKPKGFDHLG